MSVKSPRTLRESATAGLHPDTTMPANPGLPGDNPPKGTPIDNPGWLEDLFQDPGNAPGGAGGGPGEAEYSQGSSPPGNGNAGLPAEHPYRKVPKLRLKRSKPEGHTREDSVSPGPPPESSQDPAGQTGGAGVIPGSPGVQQPISAGEIPVDETAPVLPLAATASALAEGVRSGDAISPAVAGDIPGPDVPVTAVGDDEVAPGDGPGEIIPHRKKKLGLVKKKKGVEDPGTMVPGEGGSPGIPAGDGVPPGTAGSPAGTGTGTDAVPGPEPPSTVTDPIRNGNDIPAGPAAKVKKPRAAESTDPVFKLPVKTAPATAVVPSAAVRPEPPVSQKQPAKEDKTPGKMSGFLSVFRKKIPVIKKNNDMPEFRVGPLHDPSLDGALKDVNITYPVDEPFQYVHIEFDREGGELLYSVLEPALGQDETDALVIIERAFDKMISTNMDLIEGGQREIYLKEKFDQIINIFNLHVTREEQERMFFQLRKQYIGYGRIDTLMKDKYIEDISCNGSEMYLYVQHRIYGSIRTNVIYPEVELNNFVLKLAQISGRHISLLQPIRDVTLPDGSRANITLGGEVTKKGSTFTIRKFRSNPISPIELMDYSTIDAQQLAYLWILMEYKRSILVSGGTATGKTTFLNVLCSFIPDEYKIVSIEDTAELNPMHPNWIQSVTRTGFGAAESTGSASGISGASRKAPGDILLYDLLTAALRQRPEFIIVGEVRGEEAFTLFQAIAVGHAALGTIHAGSMNELLARVESNPMNVPRSLFSNLDAVVFPMHIKKGERSMRRIANIVEILELDREQGDLITNTVYKWVPDQDVFRFQGRSFLFDKIRDTYGISRDLLTDELRQRTEFLVWLQKSGIRDYQHVSELIHLYYRDREEVKRRMAGKVPG